MSIIYPIFTLVVLTFMVVFAVGASRLISVRRREVNPKLYKLMSGYEVPDYVQKLTRNLSNLLELPILFYVLGVLLVSLRIEDSTMTDLAWLFVGLRVVHTVIHITYNHTIHRFMVFVASVLTLLAMWIKFILLMA
jgi:hypothetical protein